MRWWNQDHTRAFSKLGGAHWGNKDNKKLLNHQDFTFYLIFDQLLND